MMLEYLIGDNGLDFSPEEVRFCKALATPPAAPPVPTACGGGGGSGGGWEHGQRLESPHGLIGSHPSALDTLNGSGADTKPALSRHPSFALSRNPHNFPPVNHRSFSFIHLHSAVFIFAANFLSPQCVPS